MEGILSFLGGWGRGHVWGSTAQVRSILAICTAGKSLQESSPSKDHGTWRPGSLFKWEEKFNVSELFILRKIYTLSRANMPILRFPSARASSTVSSERDGITQGIDLKPDPASRLHHEPGMVSCAPRTATGWVTGPTHGDATPATLPAPPVRGQLCRT